MTPDDAKLIADLAEFAAQAEEIAAIFDRRNAARSSGAESFPVQPVETVDLRAPTIMHEITSALPRLLKLIAEQEEALRTIANGNHDYGMGGSCTGWCAACRAAKALGVPTTSPHPLRVTP